MMSFYSSRGLDTLIAKEINDMNGEYTKEKKSNTHKNHVFSL